MHIDDRLVTVLRQKAGGEVAARIQYRQLLDLLGTIPVEAHSEVIDSAFGRLSALTAQIGGAERCAMLCEPGIRLRNPRLIAQLAADEPAAASNAIAAARLGEDQWLDLAPALPVAARSYLRARRDLGSKVDALLDRLGIFDRGLPPAINATAQPDISARDDAVQELGSIGAIVRRIEDYRKARLPIDGAFAVSDTPQLFGDAISGEHEHPAIACFDFATDPAGSIVWADPAAAPMAVGLLLPSPDTTGGKAFATALRRRQRICAAAIAIAGAPAIAGDWLADAAPRFDPATGALSGFAGRMRRRPEASLAIAPAAVGDTKSDRMRQLLHELRTPVNAIQGFAEVIQQQLFGPTPHTYRAQAATIAADAAQMLSGFEELERLAMFEGEAIDFEPGSCDFAGVLRATVAQLAHFTDARGSGFVSASPLRRLTVGLGKSDADLLCWRVLATLAAASAPGEVLDLAAEQIGEAIRVTVQLPASLAATPGERLPDAVATAAQKALSPGMFGTGFTLRLAAAEAAAAGGALERRGQALELVLPVLTAIGTGHSDSAGAGPP